ncbi:MAG TPA: hypothetical protein VGB17_09565 [Pyrinomonadaceae bacterium]|jgi:hypothetical protein
MSKTVVSVFYSQEAATQVLHSIIKGGFDSQQVSLIEPTRDAEDSGDAILDHVPPLQARLYRRDLKQGASLFVARVPERDVARLIRLLQTTGGHHIEALDSLRAS